MTETSKTKILNLALFGAIFLFYVLYIGIDVLKDNFCGNTAVDYCAYWSVGQIINEQGFDQIYNFDSLQHYQQQIYPKTFTISKDGLIFPFLYLPIFALPFSLFARFSISGGYVLYSIFNVGVSIWYLNFFFKKVTNRPIDSKYLMFAIFSIPFFQNLLLGQVNVLLLVAVGEFVRNELAGKPTKAGVWLSGLLLKPQTLILLLPYYLFKRRWDLLLGFSLSGGVMLLASYLLVGNMGVANLADMITVTSLGKHTTNPFVMMNFRMAGLTVGSFLGNTMGSLTFWIGSICAILLTYNLLRRTEKYSSTGGTVALLVLLTSTMLLTWHSHLSMSILLLPNLLVAIDQKIISKNIVTVYFLLPIFFFIIMYFSQGIPGLHFSIEKSHNLLGLIGFFLNSALLLNIYFLSNKDQVLDTEKPS